MATIQTQFQQFNDIIRLRRFDENAILRDKRDIVRTKIEQRLPEVFAVHKETCPKFYFLDQGDFANEFEVYWHYLKPHLTAISSLDPRAMVTEVVLGTAPDARTPLRLTGDARSIMHVAARPPSSGPWTTQRAIYLPLEPHTLLVPPRPDRPFWTLDDMRAILAHCSEPNRAQLASIVAGRVHDPEYLVISLPRPAGGRALFGVRFNGIGEHHPLAEGGSAARLTSISIVRRDRSFLVQRGGGHMELGSKRVLLLGCGSVGGNLAFALARAGIGALTLVDHDILTPENTYRHVLGKPHWGKRKAIAMKHVLTVQMPFINVRAIPTTIEAALDQNLIALNDFDLVVSALGKPTSELALNERARRAAGPPVVYTWLEPLGIGGHAVLTGHGGEPGCFMCLYTRSDDTVRPLHNRAAFGKADQTYGRSLAGCSNLYTPYGALDAARTTEARIRIWRILREQVQAYLRQPGTHTITLPQIGGSHADHEDRDLHVLDKMV